MDFVNVIEPEMSVKILSCLDDPSDLVRANAVSRSWRDLVIRHSLCKNLCLRRFSQLSLVDHVNVIEEGSNEKDSSEAEAEPSNLMEWEGLKKEHLAYAFLARECTSFRVESCISEAISSSGLNMAHTLESRNWDHGRALCWMSRGRSGGQRPIFSARFVRFRMGHCQTRSSDTDSESVQSSVGRSFEWTYTSEAFPMAQVLFLQSFKLPEPAVCLGGYVLVELFGCSARSNVDSLFHISISHVKVMGRSLSDNFMARALDPSGGFALDFRRSPQPFDLSAELISSIAEQLENIHLWPFH